MSTPTREQVIEWAKEAGFEVYDSGIFDPTEDTIGCCDITAHVTRLCTLAMSAGREQGLREAKEEGMNTDNSEAMRLAVLMDAMDYGDTRQAAALLRQQAERIAELEKEIADLHTTMFAAAVEIHEHWDAHCDAEGYGPANLMHRLERGIASQYGYDAKTLQRIEAERDQLRAEVERLKPKAERYEWLRVNAYIELKCDSPRVEGWSPETIDASVDAARTHKETK